MSGQSEIEQVSARLELDRQVASFESVASLSVYAIPGKADDSHDASSRIYTGL